MHPTRLTITRSASAHAARRSVALICVLAWIALVLMDVFMSAMFFSEPSPGLWLMISPLLGAAAWIAWVTGRRGEIEVHHDHLVIRHRRVLRRPLTVPRAQVARVLLDDGAVTAGARFFTGDEHEPLLWTDPLPRRQYADRPLIGDGVLPNVAIVLARPLTVDARHPLAAAPAPGDPPPPRRGEARALLVSVEDLQAARQAFTSWNVQEASAAHVVPPQVAAAAARVPADAATLLLVAAVVAALTVENHAVGYLIWFPAALALVMRMQRRRRRQGDEARADVARRAASMTPAQRAAALAAIDANLGGPPSQGPPG